MDGIDGSPDIPKTPNSLDKKTSLRRKNGEYELPEITHEMNCPACGKEGMTLTRTIYQLPDEDDVIILLLECASCNYKKSDIIPVHSAFQPGEYILTVDDGDLTHKIFRGSTGDIIIDELGIEIERGSAATFHFTNIEGILRSIEEQFQFLMNTNPRDSREWATVNTLMAKLQGCLKGEIPFIFILRDADGGSYINPSNKEKLVFHPEKSHDTNTA